MYEHLNHFRVMGLLVAIPLGLATSRPMAADRNQQPVHAAMQLHAPIKIYHIEGRRSERIVWLCEELGIPYELIFKRGDLAASMALIKTVNPVVPMAPTVDIDGQIVVESGGILEAVDNRYGGGRLVPQLTSPDYVPYFQWLHFAEGTAMARMLGQMQLKAASTASVAPAPDISSSPPKRGVRSEDVLAYMEAYLSKHPYFGGQEFSLADIMMDFPAKWSYAMTGIDSDNYVNISAWRKRIEERPAFKRTMSVAIPDGKIPGVPDSKP